MYTGDQLAAEVMYRYRQYTGQVADASVPLYQTMAGNVPIPEPRRAPPRYFVKGTPVPAAEVGADVMVPAKE